MQSTYNNFKHKKSNHKLFGYYFLEAGIVTPEQLQEALIAQKNVYPYKKIGEILLIRGWLKQNTLNYFVEKIIQPERERQKKYNLNLYSKNQVSKQNRFTLNLPPDRVCKILLVIIMILIFTNILSDSGAFIFNQYGGGNHSERLLRLDTESLFLTFYSALSLGICSILLAVIACQKKAIDSRYTRHYKFLSLLFLLLAIDEIVMMHEILNVLKEPVNVSGVFYFTWVIPAFIFLLVFTMTFISFLKSLPRKIRTLFILSGMIYVGGAVGVEMMGGDHSEMYGENNFVYEMITTVEESLEMMGILVFIYSLLFYLQTYLEKINLSISFKKKQ
ncbi:MAG: hypothetical protein QNJ41_04105 [Xenococcaceae cyanobacterium MO_188.B32]|nr:hypothetical protein [Xenococcaceae cyanobacterium MO_188.B32]